MWPFCSADLVQKLSLFLLSSINLLCFSPDDFIYGMSFLLFRLSSVVIVGFCLVSIWSVTYLCLFSSSLSIFPLPASAISACNTFNSHHGFYGSTSICNPICMLKFIYPLLFPTVIFCPRKVLSVCLPLSSQRSSSIQWFCYIV